jgi:hypothetical protein
VNYRMFNKPLYYIYFTSAVTNGTSGMTCSCRSAPATSWCNPSGTGARMSTGTQLSSSHRWKCSSKSSIPLIFTATHSQSHRNRNAPKSSTCTPRSSASLTCCCF